MNRGWGAEKGCDRIIENSFNNMGHQQNNNSKAYISPIVLCALMINLNISQTGVFKSTHFIDYFCY